MAADFVVTAGADLGDLVAEFRKLPGIGEEEAAKMARAVEGQLDKMAKAAEGDFDAIAKAAHKAGKTTNKAGKEGAKGLEKLGKESGDSASAVAKLRGVVGQMSPEVAELLTVFEDTADGIEGATDAVGLFGPGLVASMGVVGGAVALGAHAFELLEAEIDEANARIERAAEVADTLTDAHHRTEVAALRLAVAEGRASEATLRQVEARDEAAAVFGASRNALDEEIKATEAAIDAKTSLTGSIVELRKENLTFATVTDGILGPAIAGYVHLREVVEDDTASVETLEGKIESLEKQQGHVGVATKALAADMLALDEAEQRLAEEAERVAAGQRKAASAAAEHARELAALQASTRAVLEVQRQWQIDAAKAEVPPQLYDYEQQILAIAGAVEDQAITESQATALRMEALEELHTWQSAEFAKLESERETLHRAELKRIETEKAARMSAQAQALGFTSSTLDAIEILSQANLEAKVGHLNEETRAYKREARKQWKITRGINIAQALVNGAQAVLSSIATLGPPVVPNFIGIAGVSTATGIALAQTAAIVAAPPPKFHAGGMVPGRDPSERTITARRGEYVMTPQQVQAAGGAEALERLRGSGDGGQRMTVEVPLRHKVLDRVTYEVLGAGGRTGRATRRLRPKMNRNPYAEV